ncbi:hypothetical protein AAG570_009885 [Ranatra chinensis]|uniref:Tetratricopeptide repeat protein 1 n=1 Tax=Ranatra chinensis TaxID=642074 RepID=A0ABD0Z7G5_9HEMI
MDECTTSSGVTKNDIPTNEEAVNNLLGELGDSLKISNGADQKVDGEEEDEEFKDAVDQLLPDAEDSPKSQSDDYIDEEKLKEKEAAYSEEDLKRLKEEANDFKLKGNQCFKIGEYKESALAYTEGLRICPLMYNQERAILYSNRAAAKMKIDLKESAIEDCSNAIQHDPNYVKAVMRRAQLYEQSEKLDEALADYQRVLEIDPSNKEASGATRRLPHEINERNEKMKTEMLGKLKDLGNMVLKPFGLSTNNFQMVQDPNTGGYSISFNQNPR